MWYVGGGRDSGGSSRNIHPRNKRIYMKNPFIPWMNISNFRIVKFTFGYTSTNLYYNFFVHYLKKVLIIICNALNLCSVTILILFQHMPLFLLYFIILTNLYCAKTLNIVLSFVIDVHFVMDVLLVFPKIWRFPYLFGFCNPIWIYGRKINDDDDDDDDDSELKYSQIQQNSKICCFKQLTIQQNIFGLPSASGVQKANKPMFSELSLFSSSGNCI